MVDRFPVVLRGYDKDKVDEAFISAQETLTRLREQVRSSDEAILQLQAKLQEEKTNARKAGKGSTFASLGANAQQLLASAEQTSADRAVKAATVTFNATLSKLETRAKALEAALQKEANDQVRLRTLGERITILEHRAVALGVTP